MATAQARGFCWKTRVSFVRARGQRRTHASVGRSVLAGEDLKEDITAREDGRDGVDSAGESLAEENDVRLDLGVVLEAQELSSASESLLEGSVSAEPAE